MESSSGGASPHNPTPVDDEVLHRLSVILTEHLPDVFTAHRKVETGAHITNKIGRQNLVEGLSHIGVLFSTASKSSTQKQHENVALFEDHLRRTMMEAFELLANRSLGAIKDDKYGPSLMEQYDAKARPRIATGALVGVITPAEVEGSLDRISESLLLARPYKVDDTGWEKWKYGADLFKDAAEDAQTLKSRLEAAVSAANEIVNREAEQAARQAALISDAEASKFGKYGLWASGVSIVVAIAAVGAAFIIG